jgi:hypothetical protein
MYALHAVVYYMVVSAQQCATLAANVVTASLQLSTATDCSTRASHTGSLVYQSQLHAHQQLPLQATAAAPAAAAALWPRLPTYILQSSYLVGGIINLVLPQLGLSAPDVALPMTALHPLAFAGATGMLVNALHCLPLAATDGKVSDVSLQNTCTYLQNNYCVTEQLPAVVVLRHSSSSNACACYCTK